MIADTRSRATRHAAALRCPEHTCKCPWSYLVVHSPLTVLSSLRKTAAACRRQGAGGLTLTHLRGSSDYRSCQPLAQRSVLTQMNGSPKKSVNTAVNTVLTHPPGKTARVYLQKPGIPARNTWVRVNAARALLPGPLRQLRRAPTAARTACSSTRTAPCALATSAKGSIGALRQARLAGVAVRTMRSCRHQAPPWPGGSTGESTRWRCTPRGRACRRSTRLLLASTPYRTPPTSAPAVCIACSCVPLHSGARRPACMQHKHTAHRCRSSRCGESQHTAQRVRGRVAGVTTLSGLSLVIRAPLARI